MPVGGLGPVGAEELPRVVAEQALRRPGLARQVDVVAATRSSPSVQVGASPRGSLAVMKLARCKAVLEGRDFVTPDDVKAVAVPALAHRLTL